MVDFPTSTHRRQWILNPQEICKLKSWDPHSMWSSLNALCMFLTHLKLLLVGFHCWIIRIDMGLERSKPD